MDAKEFERELMADFSASKGGVMATFGYSEMRDWAEQSDDPRVRSMWERLSNCRSKLAKWCQAAEYAELRTKNIAAENAALRAEVELAQSESRKARKRVAELSAEVERLREECAFWRDRLRIASAKMDGQHIWRLSSSDFPPLVGPNADAIVQNALESIRSQPLPAPPVEEE